MTIKINDGVERNFYGITEETVEMVNSINGTIEYDGETEMYSLYIDDDMVGQNEDPNKLGR